MGFIAIYDGWHYVPSLNGQRVPNLTGIGKCPARRKVLHRTRHATFTPVCGKLLSLQSSSPPANMVSSMVAVDIRRGICSALLLGVASGSLRAIGMLAKVSISIRLASRFPHVQCHFWIPDPTVETGDCDEIGNFNRHTNGRMARNRFKNARHAGPTGAISTLIRSLQVKIAADWIKRRRLSGLTSNRVWFNATA
jgi:hypothetical protein